MPLPRITHLQFVILGSLMSGEKAGRDVRTEIAALGERKSGPAFYQLMARLEDDGLVKGSYQQKVIDGQIIRERRYKLTGNGSRAWRDTRDFYLARAAAQGGLAHA